MHGRLQFEFSRQLNELSQVTVFRHGQRETGIVMIMGVVLKRLEHPRRSGAKRTVHVALESEDGEPVGNGPCRSRPGENGTPGIQFITTAGDGHTDTHRELAFGIQWPQLCFNEAFGLDGADLRDALAVEMLNGSSCEIANPRVRDLRRVHHHNAHRLLVEGACRRAGIRAANLAPGRIRRAVVRHTRASYRLGAGNQTVTVHAHENDGPPTRGLIEFVRCWGCWIRP